MFKKAIIIAVVALVTLPACSQTQRRIKQKSAAAAATVASDTTQGAVTFLTTEQFKKKVMDFEAHPQEWVFQGDKPAIIDFFATWCGPCRRMSPTVDEIAKKYAGKIDVYKVDIDKEKQLARIFGIQSVPTLLFIPLNAQPQIQVGALEKADFEQAISAVLLPNQQ